MGIVSKAKSLRAQLLRKFVYEPARNRPVTNSVLFETFSGQQIGDSPLDIARELQKVHPELSLIWSVTGNGESVPAGMKGLTHGSAAWYQAVATSKYLVNNANFPAYFRKRQGQTYIQTWHGTPLKMIGNDIKTDRTSSIYQATMKREAEYWDYLISPSAFCSEIFPKAFATKAQLVEHGYPRNDRLAKYSNEQRNQIRQKLGVTDPNLKLVLYAPTWRDTKRGANGGWESVSYLDENTDLPNGFKLLYRGHSNTHRSHEARKSENVIDVTFYPDVAELFIAADVLVTDYSSVMFDFSVTGKPMIFLTPDLTEYESDRGFYFDFRKTAPGPICANAIEVLENLEQNTTLAAQYEAKYIAWQKKFNPKDDGGAAARVVKEIWR